MSIVYTQVLFQCKPVGGFLFFRYLAKKKPPTGQNFIFRGRIIHVFFSFVKIKDLFVYREIKSVQSTL